MTTARLVPWLLRAGWLALPFAAGPTYTAALHGHSAAVRATAAVLLWAGWGAVLVATAIPYPPALTVIRVGVPAAVLAAAWAAAAAGSGHGFGASAAGRGLTVLDAGVAAALAFAPSTGVVFVNGPSYPDERRYPLRVPGPLVAGPLELAWALTVGGPVAGALLLAARQWVAGGVVSALALPLAAVLARSLYTLARRWVVFVPAGMVLHDPMSLLDPVLFRRQVIETVRPAAAGTDSLDLTQRALGLALELVLLEKVPMVRVTPGRRPGDSGASARLLFTPTRPGLVLAEAAARRIAVG